MKYVRPLYRALFNSRVGRDLAVPTFLDHRHFYHPIAAKMVATDLGVLSSPSRPTQEKEKEKTRTLAYLALAVGAAAIGIMLARKRR